jgi:orotidine-5'-phosphate decarboxylase
MTFLEKLKKIISKNQSLVCVGLDSDINEISRRIGNNNRFNQFSFNKYIIDSTFDLVCSYKLNSAFYEAIGYEGVKWLKLTLDYLKAKHPDIPVIIDAKRGDIANTNSQYAKFIFDYLGADAVTVNPYLGEEALTPFLEKKDKGIIILARTSNPGAKEIQDLKLAKKIVYKGVRIERLYQYIAYLVVKKWNKNKNCLLVVGATYPRQLGIIRQIVGNDFWILVPGVGSQKGDLEGVLKNGLNRKKQGLIINVSRSVIFYEDPRKEAQQLSEKIADFCHFL